jgi:hypothetical protein
LIAIVDELIEPDPMPDQADFTVGVPVQEGWKQQDQFVGVSIETMPVADQGMKRS